MTDRQRRAAAILIGATLLALLANGCMKPQHQAIGPGDTGDEPAQGVVYKGAVTSTLRHNKPKDGQIEPSSFTKDAGPYVLGIVSFIFDRASETNPFISVAKLATIVGGDAVKTALSAANNREIHEDKTEVDIPQGYGYTHIRLPDGTSLTQVMPLAGADAPAAGPVDVAPVVAEFLSKFKITDPGVQPPGIAPK